MARDIRSVYKWKKGNVTAGEKKRCVLFAKHFLTVKTSFLNLPVLKANLANALILDHLCVENKHKRELATKQT